MCEANVYMLNEDGRETLLLDRVDKLCPEKNRIILINIFGQQKIVDARIKEMALVEHRILLEKNNHEEE